VTRTLQITAKTQTSYHFTALNNKSPEV